MEDTTVIVGESNTPPSSNPFAVGRVTGLAEGAVAIEQSRAVAEAQGKLVIAKRFPRDEATAFDRAMQSCKRKGLAESSTYLFNRGGKAVTGPSIRLAEELARCWGNIDYGIRELSSVNGVSEMEAYCWDVETNTYSSQKFMVKHVRDTKNGSRELFDQRDIYELTANMAARRLRSRILAVLPPDLVDAAVEQCKKTRQGSVKEPIQDRVRKALSAFSDLGASAPSIAVYFDKPTSEFNADDVDKMLEIYTSIKDGYSKISDWFGKSGAEKQADVIGGIVEGDGGE